MKLVGRKIGILLESDFYEPEIFYYQRRFAEEGADLRLLTRLWGQPSLTFLGHEYRAPIEVRESFEDIDDEELRGYAAIIVPSGMVSDRLRYTRGPVGSCRRRRSSCAARSRSRACSRGSSATACGWSRRRRSSCGEDRSWPTTTSTAT
jgi:hypothetical protein